VNTLDLWIDEERPHWKNADVNPALRPNTRGEQNP
jgi:hypothetical protein